jgi:hypothetical protein
MPSISTKVITLISRAGKAAPKAESRIANSLLMKKDSKEFRLAKLMGPIFWIPRLIKEAGEIACVLRLGDSAAREIQSGFPGEENRMARTVLRLFG